MQNAYVNSTRRFDRPCCILLWISCRSMFVPCSFRWQSQSVMMSALRQHWTYQRGQFSEESLILWERLVESGRSCPQCPGQRRSILPHCQQWQRLRQHTWPPCTAEVGPEHHYRWRENTIRISMNWYLTIAIKLPTHKSNSQKIAKKLYSDDPKKYGYNTLLAKLNRKNRPMLPQK